VVEAAYRLAHCLRPAAGAAALLEAAVVEARQGDCRRGEDARLWFLRALVRAHRQIPRPGASGPGAPELDDTPEHYFSARSGAAGPPISGPEAAAGLLDRLTDEQVDAALDRLAGEYRIVCGCYYVADLTYEEIAFVLEYPVGTVRTRLHRGRRMLQQALWLVAQENGITAADREGQS
jgi:RNA polymerase sigma-70 factor (ECF subfamily)